MLRKLQTLVESTTAPTTFHTSAADPPAAKAPRNCVGVLRVPGRVRAVASFGPSLIAVTGSNPVVRLFRDGVLALELAGHADEVNSVEFSPDGQMLLTASDDASVRCWDVAAGTSAHVMQQTCRVYCARFVPPVAASGRVVACDWDGRVWLWELGANEALRTFQVHRHVVMGVAVSADGSMFASASWDHTGVVADLGSGDMLARLDLQNDEMNTIAFSKDASLVVLGGDDKLACVYKTKTGERVSVLEGHSAMIVTVAFSPVTNTRVLTGSWDHSVRLWSTFDGAELAQFKHAGKVTSVHFMTSAKFVSGSFDGVARLWDVAQLDRQAVLQLLVCAHSKRPSVLSPLRRLPREVVYVVFRMMVL